ncbi:MAG: FHA domain-containing protein, partial [Myxococcota bacterium]
DGGDMVFGRGQDVDYTVNDNRMSRRHFQVKARRERVELEDMRSSNGTFLNKQPVSRAELSDGDWVQAGNSLIKIEFVEPI